MTPEQVRPRHADLCSLSTWEYADRKMILVVRDETLRRLREPEKSKDIALFGLVEFLVRTNPIFKLGKRLLDVCIDMTAKGVDPVLISLTDAKSLEFPPGHPVYEVLYAGHPVIAQRYYPVAQFHRKVFEHKFSEALSLLAALGATEIRGVYTRGWGREFAATLAMPAAVLWGIGAPGNVGVGGAHKCEEKDNLKFTANLVGSSDPHIPDNLYWYHDEPAWQHVATARVNHGLKDFALSINYDDDYGVNADLKVALEGIGKIQLGGTFTDFRATIWELSGRFPD